VNSNVRSWFLFKLPLLDHITTEHGHLNIRHYLPLQDPDIALFIQETFLSLWIVFKLNYIPKKSSFSPKGETVDFVFPRFLGFYSYPRDFARIPWIFIVCLGFQLDSNVFPRFSFSFWTLKSYSKILTSIYLTGTCHNKTTLSWNFIIIMLAKVWLNTTESCKIVLTIMAYKKKVSSSLLYSPCH